MKKKYLLIIFILLSFKASAVGGLWVEVSWSLTDLLDRDFKIIEINEVEKEENYVVTLYYLANNKNTAICEVVLWWSRDIKRSFDTGETQCYLETDLSD